jgi:hypothetical protein
MELVATGLAFLMALVCLIGGVIIVVVGLQQHTKKLEMRHRERMAMIERGLVPPPELDPAQFEAHVHRPRRSQSRHTSLGVALVAVGLGVMLIIGFAGGAPGPAIGVGGAIALLGAAFIVNAQLQRGADPPPPGMGSASQRQ